jgi:hypothetical protein
MSANPLLRFIIVSIAYAKMATLAYRTDARRGIVVCWALFSGLLGVLGYQEHRRAVINETPISAYVLLSVLPTLAASVVIALLGRTRSWVLQILAGITAFWIAVPLAGALSYVAESLRP